ncbi:ZYRO0F13266p [Zygosaccharomyces rouxii]|uniref:ZYRO0F13266p n=1 Tax=Zygosaccharomyces rouxii (strain ATCC 2623 / CBS 732 / NBRC 1130 / NCYC 568 / NRRL Y-229) TaxID=559307 RepID=C5DYI3_ZYGRC|nr:uncharacterized protein ZYRO0F13266g [Zygosaccharomyces rouxii]KAH9199601.1 PHD-zinc-finger like domain-containing protein [Zygosaccharomyces rouxii]CAR28844.1 ZYRO0F13266p [Zygosaccharomyces rouxii]
MSRHSNDDGPKLREETDFEELYPELTKDTLIPLILPSSSSDDDDPTDRQNGIEDNSSRHGGHTKQLIVNGTVRLEPISLPSHNYRFKKCKISIAQLNQRNYLPTSKVARKSRRVTLPAKFEKEKAPYFTKFHVGTSLEEKDHKLISSLCQISSNLHDFKTEYDMDEQDELYLNFLNSEYCRDQMHHHEFEIVMSVLETEWHHLEKQIPPRSISSNVSEADHQSHTAKVHFELYGSDDGTGTSLDQRCAVCGDADSDSSNVIVFCDGCDVAVHQECYGVVFIPEGQWLCRRCLVSKNRKVNCLFCPSHTGAFKQSDTGSWSHVVCGLWIPELFFANIHYMEPIEGINHINKSRWKLVCYICKQKMGACIQCTQRNCFSAFHVTCAKRAGLYMDFGGSSIAEIATNQFYPPHMLRSFCDRHSPPGWPDCSGGIFKTRRYFSDTNDVEMPNKITEATPQNPINATTKNKWKTNRGTPIAPNIFAEKVKQILTFFQIPGSAQAAYHICKYWSMKRELKRGAPLVRRFDPSSYNMLDVEQLKERIQVTDILLEDLSKLQNLCNLVKRRTVTYNNKRVAERSIRNKIEHTEGYMIQSIILDKFVNSDHFKALQRAISNEETLSDLLQFKDYKCKNLDTLMKDLYQFLDSLENCSKSTRALSTNLRKARDYLDNLIKHYKEFDVNELLHQDFYINDKDVVKSKERNWKATYYQELEDISDVEELSEDCKRTLEIEFLDK